MSQSVKIAGALFQNVPSISVPDENDVYHGFFDVSDTTATASDVASGKYFHDALGVLTAGTASGGGSSGLVYETGTYSPTADIARPTISFANTHTAMPIVVIMYDATGTYLSTSNCNHQWTYTFFENTNPLFPSTASYVYGRTWWIYRASNATSLSTGGISLTHPSTDADSGNAYPKYWVTESNFMPYTNSSSRYWRTGRTYKWIAVWAPTS